MEPKDGWAVIEDELYGEDDQFDYDEADEGGEFEEQLDPMSRRLMGIEEPVDEEEEYEEYEEDEEDEGVLDEAAEADRDGATADDVGEPSTSYPEPPDRAYLAADLFGEAAVFDAALWLASEYPQLVVSGLQTNPHLVVPGDVFVFHPNLVAEDELEAIDIAIDQGAVLLVAPHLKPDEPGQDPPPDPLKRPGALPAHIPLVRVDDTMAVGSQLGVAFYGE
ncbi:hypothetical protein GPECTOR_8g251 [Gonium pectorale]|uniref:Uncharacterized protein n=1 Tax=Gonium pectorale TaxID=33097 RepID=A0A150GU50_GONPE|nr:hypothetical protein GPECTOR_8g251 [Gonium pectorale]|eukprot:KXZ52870.1 hypothetical protein GPECTOR_8g251 [Gonium pectorale]